MKIALILIDIQNDYFEGGKQELVNPAFALNNTIKVLNTFRAENLPVIHVQHINTRDGATFFLPNTVGVEIHKDINLLSNEFLVVKHAPNSFFETNLFKIIKSNNITSLVICGMMTHMCIDTTTRACKDYGIEVTLISDACATKDLVFGEATISADTVNKTFMASLSGMFATVINTEKFMKRG